MAHLATKFTVVGVIIGFSVCFMNTSCMMVNPARRVSHGGVTVFIPKTWHEISQPESEGFEGLIVARESGTANLTVERLPGSFERHLQLCRQNLLNSSEKNEVAITQFGNLTGRGFKFAHDAGSGETVIFIPSGDLEGWYIVAVVSNVESGAKREFNAVTKSLKKSAPDENAKGKSRL